MTAKSDFDHVAAFCVALYFVEGKEEIYRQPICSLVAPYQYIIATLPLPSARVEGVYIACLYHLYSTLL
jgi:hypothetical protein